MRKAGPSHCLSHKYSSCLTGAAPRGDLISYGISIYPPLLYLLMNSNSSQRRILARQACVLHLQAAREPKTEVSGLASNLPSTVVIMEQRGKSTIQCPNHDLQTSVTAIATIDRMTSTVCWPQGPTTNDDNFTIISVLSQTCFKVQQAVREPADDCD